MEKDSISFGGRDVVPAHENMDESGRLARVLAERAIGAVMSDLDVERHRARVAEYTAILKGGESLALQHGGVIPYDDFRDLLAAALEGTI